MKTIICFVILAISLSKTTSNPLPTLSTTEKITTANFEKIQEPNPIKTIFKKPTNDKTTTDLIKQQTETIKKIVANQTDFNFDVIPKEPTMEKDKLAFEELKAKCQYISRLLQRNNTPSFQLPQFPIDNKPIKEDKLTVKTPNFNFGFKSKPNFLKTNRPIEIARKPSSVKYVRLEPVILQKVMLNDGRVVYYWYKSLPQEDTQPVDLQSQFTDSNEYNPSFNPWITSENVPATFPAQKEPLTMPFVKGMYGPSVPYNYGTSLTDSRPETTERTTTTTESSSYGFGSFLPFYGSYKEEPATTTTEVSTTTVTNEVERSSEGLAYNQQLKFVFPVNYGSSNGEVAMRKPWDIDPYAYYPRQLQPSTMNVRVPYSPTFHMIRAISVPDAQGEGVFEVSSDGISE